MPTYNRRRAIAAIGSALTVGLAGCSGGGGGDEPDDETTSTTTTDGSDGATGRVRVAHFSPDAPDVDVYVDGDRTLDGVSFGAVSDYLTVPTGARTVRITPAGDRDTVAFEGEVTVGEGDATVAAIGELTGEDTEFRPLVLEDDNDGPADDTARVRLVHASPDAPAVDVTLAGSGDTLFDGVAFGESGTVEVPAGTYTLQLRPASEGDDGTVLAEYPVEFTGGTVYTGFAGGYYSTGDDPTEKPFYLTLSVDAGTGGGIVERAPVRVAHMSPDAPNVDVYVDDDRVLGDVPFRAVSDYLRVPVGSHQVMITAAGDRSTVVFDGELTLDRAAYTLVAAGELGADTFEVLPLRGDRSPPGASDARVRVVHVSPDAPTVDVTVDAGTTLFDGVPFTSAGTVTVDAGDYTAQVRPDTEENDGQVVYDAGLSLDGDTVYTAFASGYLSPDDDPTDDAFELTVAQDASY